MKNFFPALLLLAMTANAQISYDFENGGIENWLESSPDRWGVCTTKTISGNGSLCHIYDNPSSGHDQISHPLYPLSITDSTTTWCFEIQHAYDPSSYNNWGYFLISDLPASEMYPDGNVSGYAIGVNISGSDDLLKIWKFVRGQPEVILTTEINWQEQIGTSQTAGIEVNRSTTGVWKLYVDKDGGFDQLEEAGTIADNDFTKAIYTGLYYKYSSANDRKLSLDNLIINGYFPEDTIKPEILELYATDSKHLKVHFSEPLLTSEMGKADNYIINGITPEEPDSVNLINDHTILLTLQTALPNAKTCFLQVKNLNDLAGNTITTDPIAFIYHKPFPGDVVINEIMADPSPSAGLPEGEYLELFNTADYEINLLGWMLTAGDHSFTFPDYILEPGAYLLISNEEDGALLSIYGSVLELFSSVYTLSNDGIDLTIQDNDGTIISEVFYNPDWHYPHGKGAGGWSLEKIDPLNNCSGRTNWTSAANKEGGTPGRQNSVYAPNKDTLAPRILKISGISENAVSVLLSEKPTKISYDTEIYLQESGKLYPDTFYMTSDTVPTLVIIFQETFEQTKDYQLKISLPDDCGNLLDTTLNFTYYQAQPYDIIFSEIMADPEPAVDLPPVEYLELFNRCKYPINLKGWALSTSSSTGILPAATLTPGEYSIICSQGTREEMLPYGKVICPDNMPALPNNGQQLILRTEKGQMVAQVHYATSWYSSEYKAEGGWSLEIIDPDNPCGMEENWQESHSKTGGTPGKQNSAFDSNPDYDPPRPSYAALLNDSTLIVHFSETIDSTSVVRTTSCEVHPEAGKLIRITAEAPDFKNVILTFESAFRKGINYTCKIITSATDCVGNPVKSTHELPFAVPVKPDSTDIIINEVLFNPFPGGADFIEIYNRSKKTFDLKDMQLAGFDEETFQYIHQVALSSSPRLLFPQSYLVFTEDAGNLKTTYNCPNVEALNELQNLPSLPDKSGRIALMHKSASILDDFSYDENMHFSLLVTNEGVSLERISFEKPTSDRSNWHSAAQTAGFATPGYQNSQFLNELDVTEEVSVCPEIFSPDNDGNDDLLEISYKFDQPGFVATITIFDAKGRAVCKLVQNEMLGSSGSYMWDGMNDTGQLAGKGIYLVYIQVFNLNGELKEYKKTCVLGGYI